MTVLSIKNIAKSYKGRPVLEDVSFVVERRQVVGLLGPNGAGKTTAFYSVMGLIKPDAGEIELDGKNITKMPLHQRAKLGISYLPQERSVFRRLTVRENILAILELQKGLSRSDRESKLSHLLETFHITHIANQLGAALSGGESRRVEIARALATDPSFILLDEPFAGVDPIAVLDMKRTIQHLKSLGIGILITDHNVRETLDVCDKAYIVNKGHILASGTPQDILSSEDVKAAYLGESFEL